MRAIHLTGMEVQGFTSVERYHLRKALTDVAYENSDLNDTQVTLIEQLIVMLEDEH